MVSGDYRTPPCPTKKILKQILESAYLAAAAPEEARYPQFNVVVTGNGIEQPLPRGLTVYPFEVRRPMSMSEFRRLAPATDIKKSAIWVTFDEKGCYIAGLCDLGTSWHRAKLALSYNFEVPLALTIQVDRPGRIKVYQGAYLVGSLSDGFMQEGVVDIQTFLHAPVNSGLEKLANSFTFPEKEHPRDYENFWFIALYNVFGAIANSISISQHGGMLVILNELTPDMAPLVRTKYETSSNVLADSFTSFINARNKSADFWEIIEREQKDKLPDGFHEAELALSSASDQLVEAIRFVAQLAGCDGAILLTDDLRLIGFGTEVRAEMNSAMSVVEVENEWTTNHHRPCDVEQFGMRHRSAIKLASNIPSACVLAISQDGPISAIWSKSDAIFVKKGASLNNLNMPLS